MKQCPPGSLIWEPHINQSSRLRWVSLRIIPAVLRSPQRRRRRVLSDAENVENITHPSEGGVIPNLSMIPSEYVGGISDGCNHLRSNLC